MIPMNAPVPVERAQDRRPYDARFHSATGFSSVAMNVMNLENPGREMVGFIERRWVLLKIPRCDIDGVGEVK